MFATVAHDKNTILYIHIATCWYLIVLETLKKHTSIPRVSSLLCKDFLVYLEGICLFPFCFVKRLKSSDPPTAAARPLSPGLVAQYSHSQGKTGGGLYTQRHLAFHLPGKGRGRVEASPWHRLLPQLSSALACSTDSHSAPCSALAPLSGRRSAASARPVAATSPPAWSERGGRANRRRRQRQRQRQRQWLHHSSSDTRAGEGRRRGIPSAITHVPVAGNPGQERQRHGHPGPPGAPRQPPNRWGRRCLETGGVTGAGRRAAGPSKTER